MGGRHAPLFTNQIYALSKWATLLVADTPNQSDVHTETTVNPIHPQIFDLLSASEYCLVAISQLLASTQPDLSQFSVLVSFIHDSPLRFNCVPVRFQLLATSLPSHQCLTISQLFKSSPYLKDSIKPWLSHSSRRHSHSLQNGQLDCDAEREGRELERQKCRKPWRILVTSVATLFCRSMYT